METELGFLGQPEHGGLPACLPCPNEGTRREREKKPAVISDAWTKQKGGGSNRFFFSPSLSTLVYVYSTYSKILMYCENFLSSSPPLYGSTTT